MDLDILLDGIALRDIIAVRQLYSAIGMICHDAGCESGDLLAAQAAERRLIGIVRTADTQRLQRIVRYAIAYRDGTYREYGPLEILMGLEDAAAGGIAN